MFRALAFMLPVVLVGCRSNETMAKETFSRIYTCPEDRITLTTRKDLVARDLMVRPATPPADIKADPARLALWKQKEADRTSEYDGDVVIEAKGCDHAETYVCGDLRVSVGATRPGCMTPPKSPE